MVHYICSLPVNFFADPHAVDEVLISPNTRLPLARVLLLPLDITTIHLLPFSSYTARIDPAFAIDRPSVPTAKTPLTHFTSAFLRRTRGVMCAYGKDAMELHDIAAVWAAIAYPPGLEGSAPGWTVRRRLFQMERYAMPYALPRNSESTDSDSQDWRAHARHVRRRQARRSRCICVGGESRACTGRTQESHGCRFRW